MARRRKPAAADDSASGAVDGTKLRGFITRILRLEGERSQLGTDIKEIYAEAKQAGFPQKHLRAQVKEQRMDREVRENWLEVQDAYRKALGAFAEEPLGKAAMKAAAEEPLGKAAMKAAAARVHWLDDPPPAA